jgi:hypothetical protein
LETGKRLFGTLTGKIIIVALILNAVLTGVNSYLVFQTLQARQVNLDFATVMNKTTAAMGIQADDANLGVPSVIQMQGSAIEECYYSGVFYTHVQIISPAYGFLTFRLKEFRVNESEYLNTDRLNETSVFFTNENSSYTIVPGSNDLSPPIYLKVHIYPNVSRYPLEGASVQLTLGTLFLEANLFLFRNDNYTNTANEFSTNTFVTLKMPS